MEAHLLQVYTVELEQGDKFEFKGREYQVINIDPLFRYIEYKDLSTGLTHEAVFNNGHQSNLIINN